MPVQKEQKNW